MNQAAAAQHCIEDAPFVTLRDYSIGQMRELHRNQCLVGAKLHHTPAGGCSTFRFPFTETFGPIREGEQSEDIRFLLGLCTWHDGIICSSLPLYLAAEWGTHIWEQVDPQQKPQSNLLLGSSEYSDLKRLQYFTYDLESIYVLDRKASDHLNSCWVRIDKEQDGAVRERLKLQ